MQNSLFTSRQINMTPFASLQGTDPAFYACGSKLLEHINNTNTFRHPEMFKLDYLTTRIEPPFPENKNKFNAIRIDGPALDKAKFNIGLADEEFGKKRHVEFGDSSTHVGFKIDNGSIYVCDGCNDKQSFAADYKIPEGTTSITLGFAVYYKFEANLCQFYVQDAHHRLPITVTKLADNMKLVVCSKTQGLQFTLVLNVEMPDEIFGKNDYVIEYCKKNINRHKKVKKSQKKVITKIEDITETDADDDKIASTRKKSKVTKIVTRNNIPVVDLPDTDDSSDSSYCEGNSEEDDDVYIEDVSHEDTRVVKQNNKETSSNLSINLRNAKTSFDLSTLFNSATRFSAGVVPNISSSGMIKEDINDNNENTTIVTRTRKSKPKKATATSRPKRKTIVSKKKSSTIEEDVSEDSESS